MTEPARPAPPPLARDSAPTSPSSPSLSSSPWPVRRTFYVSFHDTDPLNHLNHAAYFPWMETLRCDYYLALTGGFDPTRLDIILAEASCRYLAPVAYGTELVGEITPARPLGRTSFVLLYRFTTVDGKTVVARGRTVVVCYDYERSAKEEIPPERRTALERHAVDPASEGWG